MGTTLQLRVQVQDYLYDTMYKEPTSGEEPVKTKEEYTSPFMNATEDPDERYFLGLIPYMRSMSTHRKLTFRSGLMEILRTTVNESKRDLKEVK